MWENWECDVWENWECDVWENWECGMWENWECDVWENWECDVCGRKWVERERVCVFVLNTSSGSKPMPWLSIFASSIT